MTDKHIKGIYVGDAPMPTTSALYLCPSPECALHIIFFDDAGRVMFNAPISIEQIRQWLPYFQNALYADAAQKS